MRVFVTGTEGYLGSLLAPELLRRGYEVIGLDTGYYKERSLYRNGEITALTLAKDLRHLQANDLKGIDAIVHMAELSNDPAGQLAPHITYEINHKGSVRLAELAKQAGIRRFVYMSSCSVYGVADKDFVDEESSISPQTAYAECKTLVERDVRALADEQFSAALEAPLDAVHNEIFNVGDTAHNYRVREIAEIVAATFPGCKLVFGDSSSDNRSYRVSFEKIRKHLPDFKCAWDAQRGARQLYDLFQRIDMTADVFQYRTFTRLKQLEYLIRTQQIDGNFFWTN